MEGKYNKQSNVCTETQHYHFKVILQINKVFSVYNKPLTQI